MPTISKDSPLTQEYRELLDAVQEPLVLVSKADRTIAYVNPAGARLFELPVNGLIGRECHSFICPADRGQCPILDLGMAIDNSEREILVNGTPQKVIKNVRIVTLKGQDYLLENIRLMAGMDRVLLSKVREAEIFRSFFYGNSRMLFILDPETSRILEVNRATTEFYGYSAEKMRELTLKDLEGSFRPLWLSESFEREAGQRHTHQLASGDFKRVEVATGSVDWDGQKALYCIVRDVTQEEKNLQSLEESRRWYESLFAHNHTPMLLIEPDTGEIVNANGAAFSFYGYDRQQLTSMKITDINQLSPENIHREMALARAEKRNHFLFPHRLASGEIRTVQVYSGPVPLDGRTLLYSIIHDVTLSRATERLLGEKTEQLEQLFCNAPVAIHQCGPDGRLLRVNDASLRLFGYAREEMLNRCPHELLMSPEQGQEMIDNKARIESGKVVTFEGTRYRKEGTSVDVSFIGFPFHADGDNLGSFGIYQDISLRKKAEKQLEFSNRALKEQNEVLKKAWDQTIELMAYAAELRDPYTAGHQKRVSALSREIAREMQLSPELMEEVEKAALVHDLGKFEIPSEILCKPGRISKLELALIRRHAEAGYEILKRIDLPWPLAEIVYQHHERMDGSGYPRGLSGDQILIHARIIAVADVVEAMSSHRPYRAALGIGLALEEIRAGAGSLYDRDVAAACRVLFLEKGFAFPEG